MVVTNTVLNAIKTSAIDGLDGYTHMAWGDDNTTPEVSDTTLGNELLRKVFDEASVKNTGAGTYEFSGKIGLTEINGNTVRETGVFDAASGGNMALRKLLPVEIAKTSDKEITTGIKVTITVVNI